MGRVKASHSQFSMMIPAAQYYVIAFFVLAANAGGYSQEGGFGDQAPEPLDKSSSRDAYRIEIDLDYNKASFTGRETLRFTNAAREDLSSLNFYLYPNFGLSEEDKPSLEVQKVTAGDRELYYSLRSHNALLRVELPQRLQSGRSIELTLAFSGRVRG